LWNKHAAKRVHVCLIVVIIRSRHAGQVAVLVIPTHTHNTRYGGWAQNVAVLVDAIVSHGRDNRLASIQRSAHSLADLVSLEPKPERQIENVGSLRDRPIYRLSNRRGVTVAVIVERLRHDEVNVNMPQMVSTAVPCRVGSVNHVSVSTNDMPDRIR
jgi:hypothetical protein